MSNSKSAPWGERRLAAEVEEIRLGSLQLWARFQSMEFAVAHRYQEEGSDGSEAKNVIPEELEWSRWALNASEGRLILSPRLPDLPVVAHPSSVFHIVKGSSARIYVRIPAWVQLRCLTTGEELVETEIPTLSLRRTWSGQLTEGEPCYWIPTSARREVRPEMFEDHMIICPVQIYNQSGDDLQVERLTLRVVHLCVFSSPECLWADETSVRFAGGGKVSSISVAGEAPAEAPGAERVATPRTPMEEGFTARTFSRIKDLPGFGLIS